MRGLFFVCTLFVHAAGLHVGISLSQTGFLRNMVGFLEELPAYAWETYRNQSDDGRLQEWPCFWCQRVVDTLMIWQSRAPDLQLTFTIMDDGGNFSRAMENYRTMTADPSIDLLLGPSLATWNNYAANIVTAGDKILVTWSITYQRYMGGYRTEVCPYCNSKWFRETDWVDRQLYDNQSALFSRRDVSIPQGNRTMANPALVFDWQQNNVLALEGSIRGALTAIGEEVNKQLEPGAKASWVFAYFWDINQGLGGNSCRAYQAAIAQQPNTTTTLVPLQVSGLLWNPLSVDAISADVLVLCGTSSLLGEFLIQASAVHLQYKALFIELAAGVGKIFGYGSFLVNYLTETIPIPTVLPDAVDPVFGTLDDLAGNLGSAPDIASLQIASCTSILTQAIRQQGVFSNSIVSLLEQPLFPTLLGRHRQGTYAFRQFLPSNAPELANYSLPLVPGPLNSNTILVSTAVADLCQDAQYSSSLMCQGPTLNSLAYPMPFAQELFQQAYLCPEGTSLASLQCRPCSVGYFRQEGMLHCQACGAGTYADVTGAAECQRCPSDSSSCNTATTPMLKSGFFSFTGDFAFLSNNSAAPAIPDFVFGFQGTYNTSSMPAVAITTTATGLQACSQECYVTNDCSGFSFTAVTRACVLMKDEVVQLEQISGNETMHYWRQSMLEELNLSHLNPSVSGQFPVTSFGLEYAKCFVPTPCAGDTRCYGEANTGLFCNQCMPGYAWDSLFPASGMCTRCPAALILQLRIAAILLLMFFLVLGTLRAAKSVARGSLSLTVPAIKLLYHYWIIVALIFDMNFFLVSGIYAFMVRLPLEFLLRPWLLIQVECLPHVLNFPTGGHVGDAVAISLQQNLSLFLMMIVLIVILLESILTILHRLIRFCFMKLPELDEESMLALQPAAPREHGEVKGQSPPRSPRSPRGKAGRSSERFLEADVTPPASPGTKVVTQTVSQKLSSGAYVRMVRRFLWMHLEFELRRKVRTFVRRITVSVFFFVPVYLRALVIPWRCVTLGTNEYSVNVEYLGLFCDSPAQESLRYDNVFYALTISVPAFFLLLLLWTHRTRQNEPTLEVLAFLTAGLRDGQRWWCFVMEARLMLVFFMMTVLESSQLRNLILLSMSATYCLVEINVSPWNSAHNLVLNKASLMLNISVLLISILGAWIRGMVNMEQRIRNLVVVFLMIPTVLASLYGVVSLILNLFSEVFFGKMTALLKAGAITGPWTKAVFYVNNWLCGNLFEMHLLKTGGRYALDHSQLNRFERTQLLSMLVELIQGCLARHGKFRMKMVEMMLIIAFERAMQVRRGLLNVNFHENGHRLHSLTPVGFPKVLSPDPDLAPLMELKVTLAELQDALETLFQDISAGDPEIVFRSTVSTNMEVQEKKNEHHHQEQILVWDEQFQEIEGKVLQGSADQNYEEANAQTTEVVELRQETPGELLRRLTRILEEQLARYQNQVDSLAKDFKEEMVKVLGQKRLADAEDRKSRIQLAESILNQYSNPASHPAGEAEQDSAAYLKAVRQATSAAKDFLEKVKEWEDASDSYFSKVFAMLPKVCHGEEVKGKKDWEKDLREAKVACLRSYEHLEHAVKVCRRYPVPGGGELKEEKPTDKTED